MLLVQTSFCIRFVSFQIFLWCLSQIQNLTSPQNDVCYQHHDFSGVWAKLYGEKVVVFESNTTIFQTPQFLSGIRLNFWNLEPLIWVEGGVICLNVLKWLIILLSPSGDLGIGLVWDNLSPPPDRSFLVRLLKSSSNWTKLSMMGPQLFLGWYQMILDVQTGFRLVQTRFRLGSD